MREAPVEVEGSNRLHFTGRPDPAGGSTLPEGVIVNAGTVRHNLREGECLQHSPPIIRWGGRGGRVRSGHRAHAR